MRPLQTVDKKLFSPEGGRIALSANERIAEFLNFAIQAKFVYVNKLQWTLLRVRCLYIGKNRSFYTKMMNLRNLALFQS